MIDSLYIAATGLRGQQQQIDSISNNVANLQTPGFKKARLNFIDLAQVRSIANAETGALLHSDGAGTRVAATVADFSAGDVRMTRNPFDVAIDGNGFLEVQQADGTLRYSRAGQLKLDAEGFLATANGHRLTAGIQLPADAADMRIEANGEVTAVLAGETAATSFGFIELAQFPANGALVGVGDNLYAVTDEDHPPVLAQPGENGAGLLRQGFLELSNVDLIDEMTALVFAQRAYQLNARVLQASDQILETINNLRR
jgi:flagellar basal-body rod protein FlgG